MLAKRIIPCLDVKGGKVVKGINFRSLRSAGDPVELAEKYYAEGADELAFLDISATIEGRKTMIEVVRKTAKRLFIPLTVGGGVRSVEDARELLRAGADKVAVNSAVVARPALVTELAKEFGSQAVVVAIDAAREGNGWRVYTRSGSRETPLDALAWARQAEVLGAGELLVTSIDRDGTKQGFDVELLRAVDEAAGIPVIASGGAGKLEDFYEAVALRGGNADAVLAASVFHYGELTVGDVKRYLKEKGVEVRI